MPGAPACLSNDRSCTASVQVPRPHHVGILKQILGNIANDFAMSNPAGENRLCVSNVKFCII